jgi:UDPglucose 6-dehydrogenase
VVHSPEFLTERAALSDFLTPARHIIGGASFEAMDKLRNLYEARFPGVTCHLMNATSAELVKYGCNCFFATKVMYFNELYKVAEAVGADWDSVLSGVMADGRIGHSHNQVPGHDDDMGFGGKCFPKDLNALIDTTNRAGYTSYFLAEVWSANLRLRQNKDWANIEGAVVAG